MSDLPHDSDPNVYQALDVIKDNANQKVQAPITMLIQQGECEIRTEGCLKITHDDLIKQATWSLIQQHFHPRTKQGVREFFERCKSANYTYDEKKFFDPTAHRTDLHLKVLGFFELSLGAIAMAYNRKSGINLYYYHLEQGLHPNYQVAITDGLIYVRNYAIELDNRLIEAGVKKPYEK